jgi:hypothetical protein
LVDLDGDGQLDMISGSWPGEIFFFRGKGKGQFDSPIKLKDKGGKTINIGGGLRKQPGGDMILVAGDARFEETDKGQVIIYEGERIEVPEGKSAGITGTASTVHAVDWDGDGQLDLLVGNIGGGVYLVPNKGTRQKYAFAKEQQLTAGGTPLSVPHGDAGPFACDWDGDGKLDLLVGAGDGSVWFYRNIGTAKVPELAAGVQLVPPAEEGIPREPRRGTRAKFCAVDWDGDGRLDLLVGDFAHQKPDRPEPSPAEKAKHDELRKELNAIQRSFSQLLTKHGELNKNKAREERKKIEKEIASVSERMQELHRQLPPEYENHGWVWLFLRRPVEPAARAATSER